MNELGGGAKQGRRLLFHAADATDNPVAEARHKCEGHGVRQVGAYHTGRRQSWIEEEKNGHTQSAGSDRTQGHQDTQQRTKGHGDRPSVPNS